MGAPVQTDLRPACRQPCFEKNAMSEKTLVSGDEPAPAALRPGTERRFLRVLVDALTSIGIDAEAACRQADVAWPLDGEEERIDLALTPPMYGAVSRVAAAPDWNFRVVGAMAFDRSHVLLDLLLCCETSEDALRLGCRYAGINSDLVSFAYHPRDDGIDVLVTPTREVRPALEQLEFSMFLVCGYQRIIPDAPVRLVREVWLAHQPRFEPAQYEAWFGCPVVFGARHYGMRVSPEALCLRVPGGDARRLAYVAKIAERYESSRLQPLDFLDQVQVLFMQRMVFGEPSVEDIASALAMSDRTLQRRLQDEGSNWRKITDAARMRVAHHELSDASRPLREIALLTGYSDLRAFLRAFQRWAGMTPSQYRETHFS
jgi:AraC-like DNA-binding protein